MEWYRTWQVQIAIDFVFLALALYFHKEGRRKLSIFYAVAFVVITAFDVWRFFIA